jgi:hypothetical protein
MIIKVEENPTDCKSSAKMFPYLLLKDEMKYCCGTFEQEINRILGESPIFKVQPRFGYLVLMLETPAKERGIVYYCPFCGDKINIKIIKKKKINILKFSFDKARIQK